MTLFFLNPANEELLIFMIKPCVMSQTGDVTDRGQLTFRKLMYCLIASMRAWKSALAAFMLVIMEPTLPTMVAKISTPTWRTEDRKLGRKGQEDEKTRGQKVKKWFGKKVQEMLNSEISCPNIPGTTAVPNVPAVVLVVLVPAVVSALFQAGTG